MKKGKVLISILLVIGLISLTACTEWNTTSDLDYLEDLLEDDVSGLSESASSLDSHIDELKGIASRLYQEDWRFKTSEELEAEFRYLWEISGKLEDDISWLKHQIDDLESHVWEVSP